MFYTIAEIPRRSRHFKNTFNFTSYVQAYFATDTVSFSSQLSPNAEACAFADNVDPSTLQQAGQWTTQIFLGGDEIHNSPVNVSAPSLPLSSGLSYGLTAEGQQLQPCNISLACPTYFEVCNALSKKVNGQAFCRFESLDDYADPSHVIFSPLQEGLAAFIEMANLALSELMCCSLSQGSLWLSIAMFKSHKHCLQLASRYRCLS